MKLKQLSVPMQNDYLRALQVTRALGQAGINLKGLNYVDTGEFGELRLLVADVSRARRILMQLQIPAQVEEVLAVGMADRPGEFASLLEALTLADVKIRYAYALSGLDSGRAVMVFHFDKIDRAADVLRGTGAELLDADRLQQLETRTAKRAVS